MFEILKRLFFSRTVADSKRGSFEQDKSLKEKFSEIYFNNGFRGRTSRSGEGSDLVQSRELRRELPKLVRQLGIKTFMDAPCGDWYWMRKTELVVDQYIGVDIVDALIERNRQQFGNESHVFMCLNLAEDTLPQADMIFCRDCLVHLRFDDIQKIIANFKRSGSTYLLTTTFTRRERNLDLDGEDFWRPLNLELAPFNFPKPLKLINEKCTENNNQFSDKCLGLWHIAEINL